jgi:hypothetical protein
MAFASHAMQIKAGMYVCNIADRRYSCRARETFAEMDLFKTLQVHIYLNSITKKGQMMQNLKFFEAYYYHKDLGGHIISGNQSGSGRSHLGIKCHLTNVMHSDAMRAYNHSSKCAGTYASDSTGLFASSNLKYETLMVSNRLYYQGV